MDVDIMRELGEQYWVIKGYKVPPGTTPENIKLEDPTLVFTMPSGIKTKESIANIVSIFFTEQMVDPENDEINLYTVNRQADYRYTRIAKEK